MRLIFAAQGAVRNHRLKNHSRETMRLLSRTIGNRWTNSFMQLKELNGEFAPAPLIQLLQILELSWDAPNSFLPHVANQAKVSASQDLGCRRAPVLRTGSLEPRATWS